MQNVGVLNPPHIFVQCMHSERLAQKRKVYYSKRMLVNEELADVLRTYALRFNSPVTGIAQLYDYLRKYAQRNAAERPGLAMFADMSESKLLTELQMLEENGKVQIIEDKRRGKVLFVPFYFIDKIARQYDTIREKPELPFPLVNQIPQNFSKRFLRHININKGFVNLEPEEGAASFLYELFFPDDTPPIIFPSTFSTDPLLDCAIAKLRFFFQKDEFRDFISKKLLATNPGKEYTIRKFVLSIQDHSSEAANALKKSGEVYLYWSYLCAIIKQELGKKTEKMSDEITMLQAIFIIEYLNNHYRSKTQKSIQRESALKTLASAFRKPPYYFSKTAIVNFTDSRGVPLLGQYSQEDLENFILEKTGIGHDSNLAELLSFRASDGERYYVLLEKVIPLIVSLVNENRKKIRDICLKTWYNQLRRFEQTDAMTNDTDFELLLRKFCFEYVPLLYSLLNAPFISALPNDKRIAAIQAAEIQRLFSHARLLSYTELFTLNRQELFSGAKMLLPFWYTIPVISSIVALIILPHKKTTKDQDQSITRNKKAQKSKSSKKESAKEIADKLQAEFVPENKTLQDCIIEQLDLWNTIIDPSARKQSTDDVNSFIRDQMRIVQRSQSLSALSAEYIRTLAETIVNTPGLSKVTNKSSLQLYTEYYILWLILHS